MLAYKSANYPQQIILWFLDLIFPVKCVFCGDRYGAETRDYICPGCIKSIPIRNSFECIGCKTSAELGKTCYKCRPEWALDQLLIVSDYSNPELEKIIKFLKYRFIINLCNPLSGLTKKYLTEIGKKKNYSIVSENPILIPVPIHKRRYNWRGFNQAEILSSLIASSLQLRHRSDILIKIKQSRPQADIPDKQERFINASGAYQVTDKETIKNETIVLIDDLCTSGATLNECAQILKEAGAKKIIGLVVARG